MLWIIPWVLLGSASLLLPWTPGSWSQANATLVLALRHRAMPPLYSVSDLHNFNTHLRPDCMDILKETGLLRRGHPPHRGSGLIFTYNFTSPLSIPSLWSARTPTSSLRHHNKQHVNLANLRPLPQSSQPITTHRHLKLALLNTRSLNNKSLILNEFITDNNLDFLCLTETWHKPLDYFSLNQTTPTGFTYTDQPRPEGRGGGIGAVYRKDIKTTTISIPATHSFEHLAFKLSGPTPLVTAIIYRPPSQTHPFSQIFLLFSPSYVPSHPPFSSWGILTSTSMTPTANLPQNTWNCYNASTPHSTSTSPLTAVVTSWIWSAPPVSQFTTSPASTSTSLTTWQSPWTWTSLSLSLKKNA